MLCSLFALSANLAFGSGLSEQNQPVKLQRQEKKESQSVCSMVGKGVCALVLIAAGVDLYQTTVNAKTCEELCNGSIDQRIVSAGAGYPVSRCDCSQFARKHASDGYSI